MRGNIGCPCNSCKGAGSLHPDLKALLEAFELLLGYEIEIASGYRCPEHNKAIGGVEHSRHMGNPNVSEKERLEQKTAYAVDFWPKLPNGKTVEKYLDWNRKAFTFHALVKPWFKYSYINRSKTDPWRWSIHGQII